MGAGLAGIMAAISAAETGADVCIVSGANICSGSSFYPGTWGLGLIGPEDRADEEDLKSVILKIGEGMAGPELAGVLVSHIREGIEALEHMGIRLRAAENRGEKEFIPCFDYKNRDWHGIEKDSARKVFLERLNELGVRMVPDTQVIQYLTAGEGAAAAVTGVIAVSEKYGITALSCKSLVVASGGLGGLFKHRLNTDDVNGMGQYLSLVAGAKLVNLEFMQMMPGYLNPAPKTIYNEKVFRYSDFRYQGTGRSLFEDWSKKELTARMEVRSTHGPFTTRLISAPVDIRLFSEFLNNPEGVAVSYKQTLKQEQPEFIRTYFEWLKKEKHLTIDDPIRLGIFAHASNGGIKIDSHGRTGVPGLYACGEATGGMHGADRLGGLSTANGLVFGRIAGREAAMQSKLLPLRSVMCQEQPLFVLPDGESYLSRIREINFNCAMVIRDREKTEQALQELAKLEKQYEVQKLEFKEGLPGHEPRELAISYQVLSALHLSQCLLHAVLLRKESRGPHYRLDYPEKKEHLSRRILSIWDEKEKTVWE